MTPEVNEAMKGHSCESEQCSERQSCSTTAAVGSQGSIAESKYDGHSRHGQSKTNHAAFRKDFEIVVVGMVVQRHQVLKGSIGPVHRLDVSERAITRTPDGKVSHHRQRANPEWDSTGIVGFLVC